MHQIDYAILAFYLAGMLALGFWISASITSFRDYFVVAGRMTVPLLISSLTTSAAFLPFYLAESGTGEYVGSLFIVVSVTLLSSWMISLTMIPLFCVFFLKIISSNFFV